MGFWSVAKSVIFGMAIGRTVIDVFGSVAMVSGVSMQPTLNPNKTVDYVFLSNFSVRYGSIKRGDIIVVMSPRNPRDNIIKRVVGVEGDIVVIRKKRDGCSMRKVVPKGYYWIEGDHKGHTYDSNNFGPIPRGLVVAKVPAIIWPPRRWQLFNSNEVM